MPTVNTIDARETWHKHRTVLSLTSFHDADNAMENLRLKKYLASAAFGLLALAASLASSETSAQGHVEVVKNTPCLYEYRLWLGTYPRRGDFKVPEGFTADQCSLAQKINEKINEEKFEAEKVVDPNVGSLDADERSIACLREYRIWKSIYKDISLFQEALTTFAPFKVEGARECAEAKDADERIARRAEENARVSAAAEAAKNREKTKKRSESVDLADRFTSKRDEMRDIVWYQHKSSPTSIIANSTYLYFGKADSGAFTELRLVIRYYADTWLFIERAWGKADGVQISVPNERKSISGWAREVVGPKIVEWSDVAVSSSTDKRAVRILASAKKATIRLEGKTYYSDRQLTPSQLNAMQETIAFYERMTGRAWQ